MQADLASIRRSLGDVIAGVDEAPSLQALTLDLERSGYHQVADVLASVSRGELSSARACARALRLLSAVPEAEAVADVTTQAATASVVEETVEPTNTRRRRKGRKVATKGALGTSDGVRAPAVDTLPGIGKAGREALAARGIFDVLDLLLFLPRRYDDQRHAIPVTQLPIGTRVLTAGVVTSVKTMGFGRRQRVEVSLEPFDDDPPGERAYAKLVWFRSSWQAQKLQVGQALMAAGRSDEFRGVASIAHPELTLLAAGERKGKGIVAVYPVVTGVAPGRLKKAIAAALGKYASMLPNAVPDAHRPSGGLSLQEAVQLLHCPPESLGVDALETWNCGASEPHLRLAFEEFVVLALALEQRQRGSDDELAIALVPQGEAWRKDALTSLGFSLTHAQQKCIDEISVDLRADKPMRRLLQGDVGSGKTAVALMTAMHAISSGAQVAMMAPTEVLAEQHMRSLEPFVKRLGLRVALLVGRSRASHRRATRTGLADGSINFVVGTHALLSESVEFHRLGFVIVDEQHRFGVSQRLRFRDKGLAGTERIIPHLLVMTATPIPRSLALALYGGLDVSVVDEKPPGRVPSLTKQYGIAEREKAYLQVERAMKAGGKVYVVCPAIEASEAHDLRNATDTHVELSKRFGSENVVLMHGQQSPDVRQRAMATFSEGNASVLVSTTVIEVGVDVPLANAIVIENAERFGLAQLHQLRGRVGRAGQQSACLLVHQASAEESRARMDVLCETDDGFRIAEEDLRLRGPGEVFGREQSGLQGFRFADIHRDLPLFESAQKIAAAVLDEDPLLEAEEHRGAFFAVQRAQQTIVVEEAG